MASCGVFTITLVAFAKTAAERGHHVTVFDAQNQIGGQLNIAKTIPGKPEFYETLRYFEQELAALNVRLQLGRTVTAADLAGFDEIVLLNRIRQLPPPLKKQFLQHLDYLEFLKKQGGLSID